MNQRTLTNLTVKMSILMNPIDLFEPNGLSESNNFDGDLTLMEVTTREAEKMAVLGNLTKENYKLISSPD